MVGNSTHATYLYPVLAENIRWLVGGHGDEMKGAWLTQNGAHEPGRHFAQLQLRGANSDASPSALQRAEVERAVFGTSFVGVSDQQLLFNMAVAWRKSDDMADVDRPDVDDMALSVATFPRDNDQSWFHTGSYKIGTSTTGTAKVHVNYPHSQIAAAHSVMREVFVFVQVRAQANGDKKWLDTFVASVCSISRNNGQTHAALELSNQNEQESLGAFVVTVARLDALDNHGWAQDLRLYYLVVTDVDECQGIGDGIRETPRRCGVATVGPSDGHEPHCAQVSALFDMPFPSDAQGYVQVLLQPRCDPSSPHQYDDVHSTLVTSVDLNGFNATVARVDQVGSGWGQQLEVQYIAWVAASS